MQISIQNSKNNQKTAIINNIFIHSNYNPDKEAERFVENIKYIFKPTHIIITEPGISYISKILKTKFPEIKLIAIRYIKNFSEYNSDYDYVINYYEVQNHFESILFNLLGEEKLLSSLFLKWEPSSKALPDIDSTVWNSIKNVLDKSKSVLYTRQFFEQKWLINSIKFCKYINEIGFLNKRIDVPVLVISSGPSLKTFLSCIKENQKYFFIIVLSSAISLCLRNNIIPDLCLSTDGGYWAGQHLKKLNNYDIPLAIPPEALCSKKIIQNLRIIPLNYSDGLSNDLLSFSNIKNINVKRNGTVSGTALEFALDISNSDIFFAGLDLSSQKGFQHTQPNELEINNSLNDNRIKTTFTRLVKSEFNDYSLNIYKEWFQNFNTKERKVYRLIEPKFKKNTLGKIKDISLNDFLKIYDTRSKKESYFTFEKYIKTKKINDFINQLYNNQAAKKQLYPLDFIHLLHENNNPEILNKINEKFNKLLLKIRNILNGN